MYVTIGPTHIFVLWKKADPHTRKVQTTMKDRMLIRPMSMVAMMELDGEIKVLFLHSHIHVLNPDHSFLEQTHPCFAPWREWPAVFSFCSLERHHRIYH